MQYSKWQCLFQIHKSNKFNIKTLKNSITREYYYNEINFYACFERK